MPGTDHEVAIVGAGMSGLCMAANLKAAGITDFVVYEKADALGGTWRDNTYPGLTCDVPSRFYQFRFAPNPNWSRWYSPGSEINAYLGEVAERLELREHVRFGTEVTAATHDGERWVLTLETGEQAGAEVLVSACGVLRVPRLPNIEGRDTFAGHIFHSAHWDHGAQLDGRRVAVVGTGSTGAQIVGALGGRASLLELYQRTPQWIAPLPNPRFSRGTRWLRRHVPAVDRLSYDLARASFGYGARAVTEPCWQRRLLQWVCRRNLQSVKDPELRRALTPDYEPLCKRLIGSSTFYPAIQRPDVALVTTPIERITERGIRTTDGVEHPQDVIVLATGFDAHAYMRPMRITRSDGVTLDEAWADGPRGYFTVAIPGFPNLFTVLGPHSPIGNFSLTEIADTQATYITQWVLKRRRERLNTMAPRQEPTDAFLAEIARAVPNTVWATGCDSWYLGADGNPELWPWTPGRHRQELSTIRDEDFVTTEASDALRS